MTLRLYRTPVVLCLAHEPFEATFLSQSFRLATQTRQSAWIDIETLETYVRTQLLPYDFRLTEEQERELMSAVRSVLEKTTDDELFCTYDAVSIGRSRRHESFNCGVIKGPVMR